MRHKLTALIKENLYGGGLKPEGQAALIARNHLDDFVFGTTDDMLVKGKAADLVPLKRAIILETYTELLAILDDYSRRFGRGGKAVKQGMSAVLSDPDVFGQFNKDHQTKNSSNSCWVFSLRETEVRSTSSVNPNRSGKAYVTRTRGDRDRPHATNMSSLQPVSSADGKKTGNAWWVIRSCGAVPRGPRQNGLVEVVRPPRRNPHTHTCGRGGGCPPFGGATPTATTGQFAARHPILAVSTPRARKGQRGQGDRLPPEATRRHEAGVERPEVPAERHGLPTNCDGRWQQASLQLLRAECSNTYIRNCGV